MTCKTLFIFLFLLLSLTTVHAQSDSTAVKEKAQTKYIAVISKKLTLYQSKVTGKTLHTLRVLSTWELKIQKLLRRVNPAVADQLFADRSKTFAGMLDKVEATDKTIGETNVKYDAYIDQLHTTLKYFNAYCNLEDSGKKKNLERSLKDLKELDSTEAEIQKLQGLIQARRKELIRQAAAVLGKNKYLTKINKETYYYTETLKNYKEIFSDQAKVEELAKKILSKIPAFQKFSRQNGTMALLFGAPALDDVSPSPDLSGLQTSAGVRGLIQNRFGTSGPDPMAMIHQQMQSAQSQLSSVQQCLNIQPAMSFEDSVAGFKPNINRSKTFFQRLEFGSNLQFSKAIDPTGSTADIALTLGYKLENSNSIGIGLAYKLGMGSIRHIRFSHQGIGIRSYTNWKLKKNFFVSAGFEMNHLAEFDKISALILPNAWQNSGLAGITKKLPGKTKFIKSSQIQILYDFLYQSHLPVSQPVLFRFGYGF